MRASRWPIATVLVLVVMKVGTAAPAYAAENCSEVQVKVALAPGSIAEHTVTGTLCRPRAAGTSLQILVPGASYGRAYWDAPAGTGAPSYVDAMSDAGLATLALDRPGTGSSTRPAAHELTVESQAYVLHQVIRASRTGTFGYLRFRRVITVGHSLGSAIALVEAGRYGGADGLALSGLLAHAPAPGAPELIAALQPAQLEPRFADRPAGYLTTRAGTRGDLFYYAPGADASAIAFDEATKETLAPSEPATLSAASQPEIDNAIDVPVLLAMGEHDNLYCPAPCADAASLVSAERSHYPRAPSFDTLVVSESGHVLNLHRRASDWIGAVKSWISETKEQSR